MKNLSLKWLAIGTITAFSFAAIVACEDKSNNPDNPIDNPVETKYEITTWADFKNKLPKIIADQKAGKKPKNTVKGVNGKMNRAKADAMIISEIVAMLMNAPADLKLIWECPIIATETGIIMTFEEWDVLQRPDFSDHIIMKEEEAKFPADKIAKNTVVDLKSFEVVNLEDLKSKLAQIKAIGSAKLHFNDFNETLTYVSDFESVIAELLDMNITSVTGEITLNPGRHDVKLNRELYDKLSDLVKTTVTSVKASDGILKSGRFFIFDGDVSPEYVNKIAKNKDVQIRTEVGDLRNTARMIPNNIIYIDPDTVVSGVPKNDLAQLFKNLPKRDSKDPYNMDVDIIEVIDQETLNRFFAPVHKDETGVDTVGCDIRSKTNPRFKMVYDMTTINHRTNLLIKESQKKTNVCYILLKYPNDRLNIDVFKDEKNEYKQKPVISADALTPHMVMLVTDGINMTVPGLLAEGAKINPVDYNFIIEIPLLKPSPEQKAAADIAVQNFIINLYNKNIFRLGLTMFIENFNGDSWVSTEEIFEYRKQNPNHITIGKDPQDYNVWNVEDFLKYYGPGGTYEQNKTQSSKQAMVKIGRSGK